MVVRIEMLGIILRKETTQVTKEAPQWTFEKTYLVAFLGHTDANLVQVTQVFSQYTHEAVMSVERRVADIAHAPKHKVLWI